MDEQYENQAGLGAGQVTRVGRDEGKEGKGFYRLILQTRSLTDSSNASQHKMLITSLLRHSTNAKYFSTRNTMNAICFSMDKQIHLFNKDCLLLHQVCSTHNQHSVIMCTTVKQFHCPRWICCCRRYVI